MTMSTGPGHLHKDGQSLVHKLQPAQLQPLSLREGWVQWQAVGPAAGGCGRQVAAPGWGCTARWMQLQQHPGSPLKLLAACHCTVKVRARKPLPKPAIVVASCWALGRTQRRPRLDGK